MNGEEEVKVAAPLRRRAEDRALELEAQSAVISLSEGARQLVHELRVHQIELEMQNEELRRTQVELEASQARYFDLYDLAPVGYYSLSAKGLILEANLTAATMLGVSRGALVHRPITQLILKDDQDIYYTHRRRLFDSGRAQVFELRMLRGDSGSFWARVEATVTQSPDGTIVCRAVMSDISERKRTEQEREQMQGQLVQAQKLEALGTLAGGIAHDFNNLLQGIQGELSLIELELGEARARELEVPETRALVERGAELTRQLLGFARKGKYDVKPLNLAQVLERTSTMYGRTRKDLVITLELPADLRAVLMDHAQLEQVLLNLMVNAGHAMPNGGRLLLKAEDVKLERGEVDPDGAPGTYVRLIVSDTGTGMDAATQARIFEPFFTTKPPGQGHGLGLASTYGILKSHGALIHVRSELGQGATFLLYLPSTDGVPNASPPSPTALQHGRGTVMVVDDEPMVLKVCARLVEKMGYEVLSASGGRQAVELLRQHGSRVALVILDMVMPDMSGPETFRALRALAPGLKVLLSSGYSVEGEAQELLSKGCSGFLQKPFDGPTLSARLRELV
jgi:PAS domain S-box-containing protein